MKKISYLELASLIIIEIVTMYSGINITILKEGTGINSWLTIIIAYIIGFIPLLIIIYIANYRKDLRLNEKINNLFGNKIGFIINFILLLLLIVIGVTLLYNINNFILSQFLYRTPFIVSCTLLMIVIIYNVNKGINVISKTSFLLLLINLGLFSINILALLEHLDILNFFPLLKENTSHIFSTSLKIVSIDILPLLTILIIPIEKMTTPEKYNKTVIISYIIGAILSFLLVIVTFGVLGINLVNAFEYPEYIVLRKIKLIGFLERIENILSLQWIIGSFIYLTIIMYNISKSIPLKSKKAHKFINTTIGILFIVLNILIFKNNTIFDNYIKNIYPYITSIITFFYIILFIKILLTNNQKNNLQKT